jgi:hypothetical protein
MKIVALSYVVSVHTPAGSVYAAEVALGLKRSFKDTAWLPVLLGVLCASQRGGHLGMTKAVLMALLLSVGLSASAAAAQQYPRYGDPRPGGVWNEGPYACLPGQSCNCHPDAYVAVRCEETPGGPQCWWNSNCYCEPPVANQYCGSRSGSWPAFRKRPRY